MDIRHIERDSARAIEFSWEGNDEGDPASGRGWALLEGDGSLAGHLYIHGGDDSAFRALRSSRPDS